MFRIQSPQRQLQADARVSNLIIPRQKQWNEWLVDRVFWPEEASIIKDIPIGGERCNDRIIWHYNCSRVFTVRSAYHLLCSLGLHKKAGWDAGESSSSSNISWKWLWKAAVPNKVKLFVFEWRACLNALPTGENLKKRALGCTGLCVLCEDNVESVDRVLRWCSFALQVWALSNMQLRIRLGGADLFGWFLEEAQQLSSLFELVIFQHVCRGGNKAAHVLARRVNCLDDFRVWVDCAPNFLQDVLLSDSNGNKSIGFYFKKKKKLSILSL